VAAHAPFRGSFGDALQAAASAFPQVRANLGDFSAFLREKAATCDTQSTELAELYVADLYLAWSCANADPAALAIFERDYMPHIRALARGTDAEELGQLVRVRLLTSHTSASPRILQYSGRGPLAAWVRMVATRLAIDLTRAARPEARPDFGAGTLPIDPELDYLKARYAGAFQKSMERALRSLAPKDRTLLRLCYVESAPPTAIARMYNVSARTVQRWLTDARKDVLDRTRADLTAELRVQPAELDSLFQLMQSRLHVSLQRVLESSRLPGDPDR